jgi:acetyltransferase-like isoleucine patch superfamily enzyme
MGNSTSGKNTVVAARSFLRGDKFPQDVILGGTPARVLSNGVNWDYPDLPPGTDIK